MPSEETTMLFDQIQWGSIMIWAVRLGIIAVVADYAYMLWMRSKLVRLLLKS